MSEPVVVLVEFDALIKGVFPWQPDKNHSLHVN